MRFIVAGLGNPGQHYANHRHNVGFTVVNTLAQRHEVTFTRRHGKCMVTDFCLGTSRVILVKPQTFMNMSGQAIARIVDFFHLPLDRLLVVYDDVDLPIGAIRIRPEGGSGGQRGMGSIIEHINSQNIPRLRVGIDCPLDRTPTASYVLHPFSDDQKNVISSMLPLAADAVETFVCEGVVAAMDKFNS